MCCTAETKITFLSNYPPIKNELKKEKYIKYSYNSTFKKQNPERLALTYIHYNL